ncbi:MAG: hypothetical protein EZS28_009907 [Streblomastix strix]|uniref:Uncharacterized protein n=1 Tax=Streblomastix strix TaxID=222440 RepID=A0A5J4WJS4_9EUKA|nr:MAG: hypothetical protein EZS28_009907 [Streblomastix strix]
MIFSILQVYEFNDLTIFWLLNAIWLGMFGIGGIISAYYFGKEEIWHQCTLAITAFFTGIFIFWSILFLNPCDFTSPQAAKLILRNGFKPGTGGIAGGGIYFALRPQDTKGKAHHEGVIFKCEVDVGSCKIMKKKEDKLTRRQLEEQGFDSVYFPANFMDVTLNRPEYVIYDPHRVKSIEKI